MTENLKIRKKIADVYKYIGHTQKWGESGFKYVYCLPTKSYNQELESRRPQPVLK